MENASKALLIAGGMLITMLLVMLIVFFRGSITEYFGEEKKLKDIENVAQFNKQFTNYERDKVYGYEIISLANMVEDYNTRHSGEGQNDEKYKPIALNVEFPAGNDVSNKIWYDNTYTHIFNDGQNFTQVDFADIRNNTVNEYEKEYGNSDIANKLAKSISLLTADNHEEALQAFKEITKSNDDITYDKMYELLFVKTNIKRYYEYYQFKKAIFNCTGVEYDEGVTGRIISMNFKFSGKVE